MGFLSRASVIYLPAFIIAKIKAGVKEQHLQLTEAHHLSVCFDWVC